MVATLSLSLGLHWCFLQSVAWAGMIVSYSRDATFAEAISKTFDGLHPCKLCKLVQNKKHSEKDHPFDKQVKKIDMMLFRTVALLDPPSLAVHVDFKLIPVTSPLRLPPTPPPKSV